jgi:predicted nuclease of predicted toxin-antitoxin system
VRFLADECCSGDIVADLRREGHDLLFVPELMAGATDEAVLARAFDERRILLTEDKDFGELVYRLQLPARGIVLMRFDPADRARKIPRMRALIAYYGSRLEGLFVTLEADKIRARPLVV